MRTRQGLSSLAVVVATLLPLTALAQLKPEAAGKVLFTYDERKITDGQRAQLATILASDVSPDDWMTVPIRKDDALATIVDRYYDVYAVKRDDKKYSVPLPQTTRTLISLIQKNNSNAAKLVEGDTLKIPPLPVRPQSGAGVSKMLRAYDAKTTSYALVAPAGMSLRTAAGAKPVARKDPIRNVTQTVVALSADKLSNSTLNGTAQDPQLVNVTLLAAHPCVPADPLIVKSPYYAAARARTVAARAQLETAAQQRHLALLDFDFGTDHGAQVFSAASWLLEKFGVLSLSSSIDRVELSKDVTDRDLRTAFNGYQGYIQQLKVDDTPLRLSAAWFVNNDRSRVSSTRYSLPAVMMSAAMWQKLSEGRWVNMSWQLESPLSAEPAQLKNLMASNGAFAVIAAGNDDAAEVRDDLFPQSAASQLPAFVNVTYGGSDGKLFGSSTSNTSGGKVDLLAIGCGVTYGQLAAKDEGSSYASPIVAAASWVKTLLDGTPAARMRKQLLHASLLVAPAASPYVVSGGIFDPSRLLMQPLTAHYLDSTRTRMTLLDDVTVDAGACGPYEPLAAAPASQDIIVFQQTGTGKYFLVYRHEVPEFPGVRAEPACELSSLSVNGRGPLGPLTIASPSQFVSTIGHLTF